MVFAELGTLLVGLFSTLTTQILTRSGLTSIGMIEGAFDSVLDFSPAIM